jgi:hypothetical protein
MSRHLLLTGLRRSGLHACVNALMGHFPGEVQLVNDPDLGDDAWANRLFAYEVTAERVEARFTPALLRRETAKLNYQAVNRLGWPWGGLGRRFLDRCWTARLDATPVAMPAYAFKPAERPDTRIVLIENMGMDEFASAVPVWLERCGWSGDLRGPGGRIPVGVILRSPWNCLGSHLRGPQLSPPRGLPPEAIHEAWKAQAREVLGRTGRLAQGGFEPWVLVYDHYIASADYRTEVARRFGVAANEIGLSQTADFGGGSSFEGVGKTVSRRDTSKRWKAYANHPLMKALMADAEVLELAAALGMKPDGET